MPEEKPGKHRWTDPIVLVPVITAIIAAIVGPTYVWMLQNQDRISRQNEESTTMPAQTLTSTPTAESTPTPPETTTTATPAPVNPQTPQQSTSDPLSDLGSSLISSNESEQSNLTPAIPQTPQQSTSDPLSDLSSSLVSNNGSTSTPINNSKPTALPGTILTPMEARDFTLNATDSDVNESLKFSIVLPPKLGNITLFDPNTGEGVYEPTNPGELDRFMESLRFLDDSFSFKVTDNSGASDTATVVVKWPS